MGQSIRSERLVSIDIGCYKHNIAIGLADGKILDEFEVDHTQSGFKKFFTKIRVPSVITSASGIDRNGRLQRPCQAFGQNDTRTQLSIIQYQQLEVSAI